MTQPSVAVVILNWNGLHFLKTFLPSLVNFTPNAEIVIADNASSDGSIYYVISKYPQIRIIQFDVNHGFCKGYNLALKQVESDYYVLLNSDVEVTRNWLEPLINSINKDENIAVVQPKIIWQKQKEYFEYAGAAGGMIDKYAYPFCRGRVFDNLEKDKGQYDDSINIFWATGACFLIRADLYNKYDGLDELFFAHMEEIDLCWRLLNHGFQIKYVPESVVYHVGGGTLPKSNPFKTFLNHRNGLYLMYKNLPSEIRFNRIFIRMLLDAVSAMTYLLKFDVKDFSAVIKSHLDFYKHRSKLKVSDKRVNPSNFAGFYNKSVVFEYFIKKNKTFSKLGKY